MSKQTNLLKFLNRQPPSPNKGIKCYPHQSYGVSQQSPNQFKSKYSLINKKGYIYSHDNNPNFRYQSQMHYFTINNQNKPFKPERQNSLKFHRKKGLLAQFSDRNAWMKYVCPLIGSQRNSNAREISNRDRQLRINKLRKKSHYQKNINMSQTNEIQKTKLVFTEKMKIRSKRNQNAKKTQTITARPIRTPLHSQADRDHITQSMAMTTRNWLTTGAARTTSNGFDESTAKNNQRWLANRCKLNKSLRVEGRFGDRNKAEQQTSENPQFWFRSTCMKNFVYRKPLQWDTQQEQVKV